ncbi:MAG: glycosyltransferase [Actinomycetota bacterium]|nr:glycosyltransferase [Actinomycetota bacterium]
MPGDTMTRLPRASVVVPVKDGARHLPGCLEAIGAQDVPRSDLEVLVVDGGSADGSNEVATRVLHRLGLPGDVVTGDVGTTPANLNLGLSKARGEILCRVDVRARIPPQYVRTCTEILERADVAVVGGGLVALPAIAGEVAVGIARAHNNRWAMGLGRYRAGSRAGPVDTVYLGAARVRDLRAVAGWDERLVQNQDFDLNRRLSRFGTVWAETGLRVGWLAPDSLRAVIRRYHGFGRWKVRYWRLTGDPPRARQWLLLAGAPLPAAVALASVLHRRHRHRRVTGLAVLATVGLLLLDDRGSTGPAGGMNSRLVAATTLVLAAVGWLSGVALEAASRR